MGSRADSTADVSKEEGSLVSDEEIQSEMVVLIRAGDDVFGLIKVESEEEDAFTDEDDATIQHVAEKLAEQIMAERR